MAAGKVKSYDYFWNSKKDRYYDADSMGDWLRPFFANGVFNGQLQVTANNDMSVTIGAGYGYINGKHRHFLTPTKLDLETSSGTLDRIDNVILRRDDTNRRIFLMIQKGGNASSPTAPDITRVGPTYDLKLAEIYIAAGAVRITQAEITDTRMNSDVCGWVAATVNEIDFSQVTAQFNEFFKQYKESIISQYQAYIASIGDTEEAARQTYIEMKSKLDGLYDTYKKYLLENYNNYLQQIAQTEEDAETLYNTMEEKIDKLFDDSEADVLSQYTAYVQKIAQTEEAAETEYETMQAQLSALLQQYQAEFTTWFNNIKGQLSTDAAGHLQNEVDNLKEGQQESGEDFANLKAVFEKYTLQNRTIINSLSYNQLAIIMELETLIQAEVTGTGDNVIVEMFDEEVTAVKGYYDATNKRVYA